MNQLAIDWSAPRARSSDPITSHEAADRAQEFAAHHAAKILAALTEHGPMNYCEIARATGLERHAVNRRLKEVLKTGLIRKTGRNTPGDSGRACAEYEAVQR